MKNWRTIRMRINPSGVIFMTVSKFFNFAKGSV